VEARAMLDQISADSVRAANIVISLRAVAKKAPLRLGNMDKCSGKIDLKIGAVPA